VSAKPSASAGLQPLQRLQFQVAPVCSPAVGDEGVLMWIAVDHLYIDPDYQRAILDNGKANIRRIIEEFHWRRFGVLMVSKRADRVFVIMDGQHRSVAALMHPKVKRVPCCVFTLKRAEEADSFVALNGNVTRMHPLQNFRAAVQSGSPDARALVELCERGGVTIAPYPRPELAPGETMALASLKTARKKLGDVVLLAAVRMLRAMDGQSGLSAAAIQGACHLLKERTDVLAKAEATGRLLSDRGNTLAKLDAKADERRLTRGGPKWMNFAALLSDAIASAQRTSSLPMKRLMAGR